ncbi:hypothetical protein [Limimaricola pyoseonensis]|uniref:Uncharacterized protein n=1 Tax=Limimaricola pyoseonensis TaxID=521013 RepID=A0A1G7D247_9RHOB|nr:hypothetical protein [Limimaricola pyoseonensis]SDE45601.1 hypothetical protein SAMN04488567_1753 [Limimaricola pyoseonensis]
MRQPAPDYTAAFLTTLGVLLFFGLLTVAAIWGWVGVMLGAWGFDRLACPIARRVRR